MSRPGGTLYIKTFGCQMNAYDSERIAELLAKSHHLRLVEDPAEADLIVLNTCHVREKAEEKLFSELGRLRKLVGGRKTRFAVGGCVGQAEGATIFRRAPYVDLVFGPQNYHRLPQLLDRLEQGASRLLEDGVSPDPKFDELPRERESGPAAMVTVQEGCDRFCTYCVVPYTRGREWSRPVDDVVAEVAELTRQGAREIMLLGQNVNAYRGLDHEGTPYDLALLLRRVVLMDGVERLRFTTSHPADMNQDLVEVFGDLSELCPYLHLPIQSGSDRILTLMERGHTVGDYLDWVARLRRAKPDLTLSSDFIVGFPGESEADFEETMAVVREVEFGHAYSFKYSPRPGTPAAALGDPVGEGVAAARLERLQELLNQQRLAGNLQQVGRVESVLVEGFGRQGELAGRTPGWRKVNFAGPPELVGRIVPVAIVAGLPNSLRGEWVRDPAAAVA